ncbi:MAG: type II toxin-antitoxin system prevent-host-death family antitoxin [Chloroflexota bacterium]
MARIGIRELRQNASEYVRRAEKGEVIEVTDRGRPVAQLTPLPQPMSVLDRWILEGKATRATGNWADLGPPVPLPPGSPTTQQILDELREDTI